MQSIYEAVKSELGDGPEWPSKDAYTRYYEYAKGAVLGAFDTRKAAVDAGATAVEPSFDEVGYQQAKEGARGHRRKIEREWETRLRNSYPALSGQVFAIVFGKAWEDGHSSGYGAVENELDDLVALATDIIAAAAVLPYTKKD